MTTRRHLFTEGEHYHLYNRGNSKQVIFLDEQDYKTFQHYLYIMNMEKRVKSQHDSKNLYSYTRDKILVNIGAYCIMPNHFHILLTEKTKGGISKFMLKVSTAYTMYFNNKYARTGSLYEGTFKSRHVNNDIYLKYLYSYIHLNPLKLFFPNWKEYIKLGKNINTKTINQTMEYPFSSISYYLMENRSENKILEVSSFPEYFYGKKSFAKEIFTWIKIGDYLN